jgi:hypothetical protein
MSIEAFWEFGWRRIGGDPGYCHTEDEDGRRLLNGEQVGLRTTFAPLVQYKQYRNPMFRPCQLAGTTIQAYFVCTVSGS